MQEYSYISILQSYTFETFISTAYRDLLFAIIYVVLTAAFGVPNASCSFIST